MSDLNYLFLFEIDEKRFYLEKNYNIDRKLELNLVIGKCVDVENEQYIYTTFTDSDFFNKLPIDENLKKKGLLEENLDLLLDLFNNNENNTMLGKDGGVINIVYSSKYYSTIFETVKFIMEYGNKNNSEEKNKLLNDMITGETNKTKEEDNNESEEKNHNTIKKPDNTSNNTKLKINNDEILKTFKSLNVRKMILSMENIHEETYKEKVFNDDDDENSYEEVEKFKEVKNENYLTKSEFIVSFSNKNSDKFKKIPKEDILKIEEKFMNNSYKNEEASEEEIDNFYNKIDKKGVYAPAFGFGDLLKLEYCNTKDLIALQTQFQEYSLQLKTYLKHDINNLPSDIMNNINPFEIKSILNNCYYKKEYSLLKLLKDKIIRSKTNDYNEDSKLYHCDKDLLLFSLYDSTFPNYRNTYNFTCPNCNKRYKVSISNDKMLFYFNSAISQEDIKRLSNKDLKFSENLNENRKLLKEEYMKCQYSHIVNNLEYEMRLEESFIIVKFKFPTFEKYLSSILSYNEYLKNESNTINEYFVAFQREYIVELQLISMIDEIKIPEEINGVLDYKKITDIDNIINIIYSLDYEDYNQIKKDNNFIKMLLMDYKMFTIYLPSTKCENCNSENPPTSFNTENIFFSHFFPNF